MKKGDIILVPFPFTDLKVIKNRPALLLVVKDLYVIVCFISTQLRWKERIDIVLEPSQENRLKKKSLIKISKIATIDRTLIIGKIGSIDFVTKVELDRKLIELFKLADSQDCSERHQTI